MQPPTSYLIKVYEAQANTILDFLTDQVVDNAKKIISNNNNRLKETKIG